MVSSSVILVIEDDVVALSESQALTVRFVPVRGDSAGAAQR